MPVTYSPCVPCDFEVRRLRDENEQWAFDLVVTLDRDPATGVQRRLVIRLSAESLALAIAELGGIRGTVCERVNRPKASP